MEFGAPQGLAAVPNPLLSRHLKTTWRLRWQDLGFRLARTSCTLRIEPRFRVGYTVEGLPEHTPKAVGRGTVWVSCTHLNTASSGTGRAELITKRCAEASFCGTGDPSSPPRSFGSLVGGPQTSRHYTARIPVSSMTIQTSVLAGFQQHRFTDEVSSLHPELPTQLSGLLNVIPPS